ncbi:hypothetical protein BIS17_07845, partial [Bordetella pertussis]|nr:hypothetical protein [Bordetella pertussis]
MNAMPRHKLVVLTNPVEGREQEFDDWYMNTHMPDVMRVPGFVSGQRFTWAHAQAKPHAQTWRYLTILEIDTDDLQATLDDLMARPGTAAMRMSDALAEQRLAYVFTAATPVFAPDGAGGITLR